MSPQLQHSAFDPLWSKNSSSLPRKGSLPDRSLMPLPAHSTSADHPVVPDTAAFPVLHGLLESAKGIAVGCLCLGDFFPHGSGLRSGAARAAMSLHPTRSASPGIPPDRKS